MLTSVMAPESSAPTGVKHAAQTILNADGAAEDPRVFLQAAILLYSQGYLTSLVPILPILLRLKGAPYSLHNHFAMEPLFATLMPKNMVYKAGRQVTKSTTLAAQGIVQSAIIPYFSSLYIAPRFDQTRRFSNNYVKPFLSDSYLGKAMLDKSQEQSVLQRNFINGSVQHYSFAFLDCGRVRGTSADLVRYDEIEDIDDTFIPIIDETMSASNYALRQFSGTPKTMDNTLQLKWEDSSMAEWVTKCPHCQHWNIASVGCDLLGMIQARGLSCAKCEREIDAETGHYEHAFPDKATDFPGYHIPQPIMPMHYRPNPLTNGMEKWRELYDAKCNMAKTPFYNEKLGESCDVRVSLLTKLKLQQRSVLKHRNNRHEAVQLIDQYVDRILGIDWGGGGESGISHTTLAVLGVKPSGDLDVIYGERLADYADSDVEVAEILQLMRMFRCSHLAHDFNGSGAVKEVLLLQAGITAERIFPAVYMMATAGNIVTHKAPGEDRGGRDYYVIDKARSLILMCELIKHGYFSFPQFDTWSSLASDLLALVEDKRATGRGSDIFLVTRKANKSDDFAHAINYAALCHWHVNQRYPNLAKKIGIRLTRAQEAELKTLPKT